MEGKGDGRGHALLVPHPVQGHINPMMVLAQNLASNGVLVTLVNTHDSHTRMTKASQNLGSASCFANIRLVQISDGLPLDYDRSANFEQFMRSVDRMGDALGELIQELQHKADPPISCLIADSFLPWTLGVARKFKLPWVFFWTQSIAAYVFYSHLTDVIANGHFPPRDSDKIDYIPGLPTLDPQDLPSFIQKGQTFDFVLHLIFCQFKLLGEADWVIGNSVYELESQASDAIQHIAPITSIGPLLPLAYLKDKEEDNHKKPDDIILNSSLFKASNCMPWLDCKPQFSVLYVSFGSLINISKSQLEEIAMGLLESGQFILWVVRFDLLHSKTSSDILPQEFLEKCNDRILIIPWAPQLSVLSHPAVGGFMCHCGWNSTIESLSLGVPVIAFPQWSEQYINRKLLVQQWKIGLDVKANSENGIVDRKEVAKAVRAMIQGQEGKELRLTAQRLRKTVKEAVAEGGSSHKSLRAFLKFLASPTVEE